MKVALADYISCSDSHGQPLGHGKKVFIEYFELISSVVTEAYAYKYYFGSIPQEARYELKYYCKSDKTKKSIWDKMDDYKTKFFNLHKIFSSSNADIIWFTNVDRFLFIYLGIFNPRQKIAVTLYRDVVNDMKSTYSENSIKLKKFLIGFSKVNLIIKTNSRLINGDRDIYIPDYVYTSEYEKYSSIKKTDVTVCLGTVRKGKKDILNLIYEYKALKRRLIVAGVFLEEDYYNDCLAIADENIQVENRILDKDEYYQLMGRAKYVALPYKMNAYEKSTSGVLLEAVFLGAIPIAPKELLEYNSINGIGYESITDLRTALLGETKTVKNDLIQYSRDVISKKLYKSFED